MKKLGFILFTICIIFASCNKDDEPTIEEDSSQLSQMQSELYALTLAQTNSQTCTNPEDWGFLKVGNQCGDMYLLYSKKTDTTEFLKKVEEYKKFFAHYLKKWGGQGDCNYYNIIAPMTPIGIQCVNNKPQFIYKEQQQN